MIQLLLIDLVLVLLVSLGVSLSIMAFQPFTLAAYGKIVAGMFSFICLVGWAFNAVYIKKLNRQIELVKAERERIASSQDINVRCAYCGEPNTIPMTLWRTMEFACLKCQEKNGILVNFATTRTTTPLDMENPLSDIAQKVVKQQDSEPEGIIT